MRHAITNPDNDRCAAAGDSWPLTHRVAVGAYIFCRNRVLLLKRVNPPHTFAAVGGRLRPGEDPLGGLHREIAEETNLTARVLTLAHYWFGSMDGLAPALLCMNFIAETADDAVRLSAEHSAFVWAKRAEIETGAVNTLDAGGFGYQPRDILAAFDAYEQWTGSEGT